MALSDTAIRAAKPRDKQYKLHDEKGLLLIVRPTGGKLWRLKYRFAGKEQQLTIGTYPEVGLKEARERPRYRDDEDQFDIDAISHTAGRSTHEVRTWVAAFSALRAACGSYHAQCDYYRPINEWIAGYGVVSAQGQ